MIELGTLVRYKNYEEMAIVIDHWIDDNNGEYHTVVKWLTGYYVGKRTAEYDEDLEVIG